MFAHFTSSWLARSIPSLLADSVPFLSLLAFAARSSLECSLERLAAFPSHLAYRDTLRARSAASLFKAYGEDETTALSSSLSTQSSNGGTESGGLDVSSGRSGGRKRGPRRGISGGRRGIRQSACNANMRG